MLHQSAMASLQEALVARHLGDEAGAMAQLSAAFALRKIMKTNPLGRSSIEARPPLPWTVGSLKGQSL